MRKRRSIRLKNFDYSSPGSYFITICSFHKHCIFGKIINGKMKCNELGKMIDKLWNEIPEHYPHIELDEYVIMPNHVHGILNIVDDIIVGVQYSETLQQQRNTYQHIIPRSICSAIRGYKLGVTKWARKNTDHNTIWQRNYYDHIITNDNELDRIRDYIKFNPLNWQLKKNEGQNIWDW